MCSLVNAGLWLTENKTKFNQTLIWRGQAIFASWRRKAKVVHGLSPVDDVVAAAAAAAFDAA